MHGISTDRRSRTYLDRALTQQLVNRCPLCTWPISNFDMNTIDGNNHDAPAPRLASWAFVQSDMV